MVCIGDENEALRIGVIHVSHSLCPDQLVSISSLESSWIISRLTLQIIIMLLRVKPSVFFNSLTFEFFLF